MHTVHFCASTVFHTTVVCLSVFFLFTFQLCLQFHTEAYTPPDPERARLATCRHRHCSDYLTYRASPCVSLYFILYVIVSGNENNYQAA